MEIAVLLRRLSWLLSLELQLDMHFHGSQVWNIVFARRPDLPLLGCPTICSFFSTAAANLSLPFQGSKQVLRISPFFDSPTLYRHDISNSSSVGKLASLMINVCASHFIIINFQNWFRIFYRKSNFPFPVFNVMIYCLYTNLHLRF